MHFIIFIIMYDNKISRFKISKINKKLYVNMGICIYMYDTKDHPGLSEQFAYFEVNLKIWANSFIKRVFKAHR